MSFVYRENYQRILEHVKQKLEVPAFEWRRVLKVGLYILISDVVSSFDGVHIEEWATEVAVGLEK